MQIGFYGFLTLIFITLKLTDHIDWSWWLVLLPSYAGLIIFLGAVLVLKVFELLYDRK